jgi:branched-subunit amino acid transport protein AzlD
MLSLKSAIAAVFLCAVATFFTRVFPFILFRVTGGGGGARFKFVQRYIPPMTMVILVAYCFKDLRFENFTAAIPVFSAALTALVHILLKNPLISIFSGTAIYMAATRLLG